MNLHILNDLHVEFEDFEPSESNADVVVLAGDIGVGMGGLRWAAARFPDKPVIYVPGNHEFYHHDIALIDALKADAPANIHLLDDDQVVIDEVRFLGSILWADFALFGEADKYLAMQTALQRMPDFSIIQNHGRQFTPEDAVRLHTASRDWLAARLGEPFDGKTVVAGAPRTDGPDFLVPVGAAYVFAPEPSARQLAIVALLTIAALAKRTSRRRHG